MERQESGGFHPRPEFSHETPERIFEYAKEKQQWIHKNFSPHQIHENIESEVAILQQYVAESFDGLPDVVVQTDDVLRSAVRHTVDGKVSIESSQLPLDIDARVTGLHTVKGALYGFHKGRNNDIRFFLIQDEPIVMDAGVYTPLISIGVAGAYVSLGEQLKAEEQTTLQRIGAEIQEKQREYGPEVQRLLGELIKELNAAEPDVAKKLHASSTLVIEIMQNKMIPVTFIDDILDYIRYKLELTVPQDITVSSYRLTLTEKPIKSYQQRGDAKFTNVTPQLGVIVANKSLCLSIWVDGEAINIPAESLKIVEKSVS